MSAIRRSTLRRSLHPDLLFKEFNVTPKAPANDSIKIKGRTLAGHPRDPCSLHWRVVTCFPSCSSQCVRFPRNPSFRLRMRIQTRARIPHRRRLSRRIFVGFSYGRPPNISSETRFPFSENRSRTNATIFFGRGEKISTRTSSDAIWKRICSGYSRSGNRCIGMGTALV